MNDEESLNQYYFCSYENIHMEIMQQQFLMLLIVQPFQLHHNFYCLKKASKLNHFSRDTTKVLKETKNVEAEDHILPTSLGAQALQTQFPWHAFVCHK